MSSPLGRESRTSRRRLFARGSRCEPWAFVLALTPPWAARRMASSCCAQLDMMIFYGGEPVVSADERGRSTTPVSDRIERVLRRCHHSSVECEILEARSEFRPCPCPGAAPSPWPGSGGRCPWPCDSCETSIAGREPASGLTVAAALTLHPSVPRPSQSLQPRGRPAAQASCPSQSLQRPRPSSAPGPHSRCSAPPPRPSVAAAPRCPSQSLQRPGTPHSRCSAQALTVAAAPQALTVAAASPTGPHSRCSARGPHSRCSALGPHS